MIEPPSTYEMAVTEAVATVQGTQALVFCAEHAGEVGVIRYTPRGRLFKADVPVESGSGVARCLSRTLVGVGVGAVAVAASGELAKTPMWHHE